MSRAPDKGGIAERQVEHQVVSIEEAEVLNESCGQRTCGSGGVVRDRALLTHTVAQGIAPYLGIATGDILGLGTDGLCIRMSDNQEGSNNYSYIFHRMTSRFFHVTKFQPTISSY